MGGGVKPQKLPCDGRGMYSLFQSSGTFTLIMVDTDYKWKQNTVRPNCSVE